MRICGLRISQILRSSAAEVLDPFSRASAASSQKFNAQKTQCLFFRPAHAATISKTVKVCQVVTTGTHRSRLLPESSRLSSTRQPSLDGVCLQTFRSRTAGRVGGPQTKVNGNFRLNHRLEEQNQDFLALLSRRRDGRLGWSEGVLARRCLELAWHSNRVEKPKPKLRLASDQRLPLIPAPRLPCSSICSHWNSERLSCDTSPPSTRAKCGRSLWLPLRFANLRCIEYVRPHFDFLEAVPGQRLA